MIPTPDAIQRASQILNQIGSLQVELVTLFGHSTPASPGPKRRGRPPGSGKVSVVPSAKVESERKMSTEGRARIAAAAKARWAKFRADQGIRTDNNAPAPVEPSRKGSGMSASGRAAIAAAQKARWAKVRSEKKKAAKA